MMTPWKTIVAVLFYSVAQSAIGAEDSSNIVGNASAGETKAATCIACHGDDGNSPSDQFPKIGGQVPGYLAEQLRLFKSGERENAVMAGIVANLTPQDMMDLDAYYAEQQMTNAFAVYEDDAQKEQLQADLEAGRLLYKNGQEQFNIAPCMACHGPSGKGISPNYPRVAGQYANYLESQLLAYKNGQRKNIMMNTIAYPLSEQQIKQLALYMSVLSDTSAEQTK